VRPHPASLFDFDFYEPLPIQIEVSEAPLTSDAGLLPLRQFDERLGLTKQFAAVFDDPRDPELTEHTFPEMVRSRVYGIRAGYADQNDHANRPRAPKPSCGAGHRREWDSIPNSESAPSPA
jgi:hypothetical protein